MKLQDQRQVFGAICAAGSGWAFSVADDLIN
jgi:hypothetical protein